MTYLPISGGGTSEERVDHIWMDPEVVWVASVFAVDGFWRTPGEAHVQMIHAKGKQNTRLRTRALGCFICKSYTVKKMTLTVKYCKNATV